MHLGMGGFFSKTFDPVKDIPNLTGKVAVVSGANSGIGFDTALQLANHGAKVYLGVRSEAKAKDTIERMEALNPELKGSGRLEFLILELGSIKKSRQAAETLMSKESKIDIIVNNAALVASDFGLTDEGISTSFSACHLGHFAFTTALLPVLNATAKLPGSDVRVINVSSTIHASAPKELKFDSVEEFKSPLATGTNINTLTNKFRRYGAGKLANILFTKELQRRWDLEGILAIAITLHPGNIASDGALKFITVNTGVLAPITGPLARMIFLTPLQGATNQLFAATSPEVKADPENWKAQYLLPYGKIAKPTDEALDEARARALWETSEVAVQAILKKGRL